MKHFGGGRHFGMRQFAGQHFRGPPPIPTPVFTGGGLLAAGGSRRPVRRKQRKDAVLLLLDVWT
jgi:hypothetical protein